MSSLCQKALHIVTELCFAGQVEWEKCSGIFPPDRGSQGAGSTGNRGRAPLASSRPAGTPRSPPGARVPRPPRGAGGILGTTRLPTSLLLATQRLATSSAGCSALVSSPPARLLTLLGSAPCPPAPSGSLAPGLPRPLAALSHASRLPPGAERRARAVAPGPLAQRCPRGPLAPSSSRGSWIAEGAGWDSPCLNAKTRFANGAALVSKSSKNLETGNPQL